MALSRVGGDDDCDGNGSSDGSSVDNGSRNDDGDSNGSSDGSSADDGSRNDDGGEVWQEEIPNVNLSVINPLGNQTHLEEEREGSRKGWKTALQLFNSLLSI